MLRKFETNGALLRLEKGEELVSALTDFVTETGKTFSFTILGATSAIELGFYHLKKKSYSWKEFDGEFEITGGAGNTAYFDSQPFVHLHATIADDQFHAYGGHVRKLVVGATCEVTLVFHDSPLLREKDEEIGLNLWKIDAKQSGAPL